MLILLCMEWKLPIVMYFLGEKGFILEGVMTTLVKVFYRGPHPLKYTEERVRKLTR